MTATYIFFCKKGLVAYYNNPLQVQDLNIDIFGSVDEVSHLSYFAFDAVLVLAQALNDTLTGWNNNSPNRSFCGRENEVNELAKCFIMQKIQNINIAGLTVSFM